MRRIAHRAPHRDWDSSKNFYVQKITWLLIQAEVHCRLEALSSGFRHLSIGARKFRLTYSLAAGLSVEASSATLFRLWRLDYHSLP